MKRICSIVLTLCLILCFTVNAGASAAENTSEAADAATAQETTAEQDAAASQPAVSESSENESDYNNPIGDNSSYYKTTGFTGKPKIDAESAILIDATTGAVLYEKKADTVRYPASITKIMTALLTIENCSMDETVTFSDSAVNGIEAGSSSAGINVGAQLSVEDTLYAMMLASANEAAAALAEHVGGSNDEFAEMMTKRAEELGCENTNFTNPHGLPDENHYTSARDMALILKQAMKYDDFRTITGTISHTLEKSDTLSETLELWNHAKILRDNSEYYYKYAEGAKTGFTQAAWNTLASYAKKGDVELICVVLKDNGADKTYNDSKALFEWGFSKVKAIKPLEDYDLDAAIASCADIDKDTLKSIQSLDYTYNKDYYTLVKNSFTGNYLKTEFVFDEDKNTGLLGYIVVTSKDQEIARCPVTYNITSDNAVRYINGQEPISTSSETSTETSIPFLSKLGIHLTITELIVCAVSILIIIIILAIIIHGMRKKSRQKKALKAQSATTARRSARLQQNAQKKLADPKKPEGKTKAPAPAKGNNTGKASDNKPKKESKADPGQKSGQTDIVRHRRSKK